MAANQDDIPAPLHDPLAELERHLIRAYVAGAGEDLEQLLTRHDAAATKLLSAAARHAAMQLAEVEARWRYLRELRGQE